MAAILSWPQSVKGDEGIGVHRQQHHFPKYTSSCNVVPDASTATKQLNRNTNRYCWSFLLSLYENETAMGRQVISRYGTDYVEQRSLCHPR